ncbi:hypothetical protein MUY35_09460 [Aliiroseovarius sp. S1339]|uniref:hypothetical protein n=1 Tax=Aliiroseovarius sp. S1339 TaxID=2936990 RepID=UPI0020BFAA6E|nr:hypothetical protein [Aliiroseovarius sp. S1339]MCK8464076.1 hypothetical protein [Aliiroseovarius sp. S1339]
MRAFSALFLAFCLVVLPVGFAQPQTSTSAPRGVERIPGYTGLYVADANRFMAGAFLVIMLTQPRDVRAFLTKVKTCASNRPLVAQLREERLRTAVIPFQEVFPALRAGACDIFIGTDFDLAQLDRRIGQGPGSPGTTTPNQPDEEEPDGDVIVDRTPPEIAPLRQVFEGPGRTIKVSAKITDGESGIRTAFVVMANGGRVQMSASQGASTYSATVNLPRDFDSQIATIVATNNANLSARARFELRLLPWCGPREAVSQALVKNVQENLACVGNSPGGSDGALGPNTCRAIEGYLRDRMPSFNEGRIRWETLREELSRACLAAQPVVLDVPGPIEVDSPQANVRISLRQPGLTETIRITGPGVGTLTRPWLRQPLIFDLPMPLPGRDAVYQVQALGPNGNALDTATLRLIRPPAAILVRPSGIVTTNDVRTDFAVSVTRGASEVVRIEARPANADPIGQQYSGGSTLLSLRSPDPGASHRVTFVALDQSGNVLAEQTVTVTRPAPIAPPRLTLESPAGNIVDAATVRLQVVMEERGAADELILRGGPDMAELARARVGDRVWETTHELPPPGESIGFQVQAVDRTGKALAEDEVRIERPPVRMQVQPTGLFEANEDDMTVQAEITAGADWIDAIVARSADNDPNAPILGEGALAQGRASLQLDMPEPGGTRTVEIVAIGRDGQPFAPAQITLVRPAPIAPVTLLVTSPDGFAIDAQSTRLSVEVVNPAATAVIVVSDATNGQVLERVRYGGDDWLGQVKMPEPGFDRLVVVEAQNVAGETLARSQITLLRPAAPRPELPSWAWIGGLILAAIAVGYLAARIGGRAQKNPSDPTVPPPRPRIFAEPDHDPKLEIEPTSPPTLMLRIQLDEAPEIEIEMEPEKKEHRDEQ